MKVLFAVVTLIPFLAQANVDMVMGDATQDELIISWSYNNSSFAGKYTGTEFTQVVAETGMDAVAVTIATDNSDEKHILFVPYTEYGWESNKILSYSYNDFAYESTYYLQEQEHERIGFVKAQDERWDAFLAHSGITLCSSATILNMFQYSYSISTDGTLTETAAGFWDKYYYFMSEYDLSSEYIMMVGPVACAGSNVLTGTSCVYMTSSSVNHTLVFDPASTDMLCHTLGEGWNPELSGVMGLGSSSDTDMILLYSDNAGDVNWSTFGVFSPVPESTDILPWDFPALDDPMAFTSTFELPGMLMVWYRDGEIRCRHWNGAWNNYDYFVANSPYAPDLEEIAVCADTDGYWIAWLPMTASEPEVVFVSFSDVTGVEESEYQPVEPVPRINPVTNPTCGNLSVEISGVSSGRATVTDLCGRTVLERDIVGEGIHSLGELPVSGIYFVRLQHSSGDVSCRVVSF
ncbi:MAG: T9SS type A sorting domain-containing protein [Candidatus Sabulitectum sp.]|nr:T9SS type A sorting domain-containing protein [Candidatus Sabulitectum sp.]